MKINCSLTPNNVSLNHINFKAGNPPKTMLLDMLHSIRKNDDSENLDIFIKEVSPNKDLASQEITGLAGRGSAALAFNLPDGKILKLSAGNHFPMNRPHESFDVPVYKKGKSGKMYYYIEEKLYQHGLSPVFVQDIKDAIKQKGYKTFDFYDYDIHQIGISKEGKLYLLDSECARYKTIFHALFDKTKTFIKKLKK